MALTRSEHMARIRSINTGPEMRLRSHLWARGLRYRLHRTTPVGRPDLVFPGSRVAVYVDGCFWHGCPLHYVAPRTKRSFWASKLAKNVERDRLQTLGLEKRGWTVIRVWEHEVDEELPAVGNAVERVVLGENASPTNDWRVYRVEDLPGRSGHERRYLVDLRVPNRWAVDEGPRFSRRGPADRDAIARRWTGPDLDALCNGTGEH